MCSSKSLTKCFLQNKLLILTLVGVVFGILLGILLRPLNLSDASTLLIAYPGELFMRLLKMFILPLIISSLIVGSSNLNDKMSTKITVRTLLYFAVTSLLMATIGTFLALIFQPGNTASNEIEQVTVMQRKNGSVLDSFMDLGRNIIADNIVQATFQQTVTVYQDRPQIKTSDPSQTPQQVLRILSHRPGTNTLGLVFFCLLFGTVLGQMEGNEAKVVISFFTVIFEVIMKLLRTALWSTPIGVMSLIAAKIISVENLPVVFNQLLVFIGTFFTGFLINQFIVLQVIYFLVIRKNPFLFYRHLIAPAFSAFATCSTAATLPFTFQRTEGVLKIDRRITRFVLPIAAHINTNCSAMFLTISAYFIARLNGIELDFGDLCTITLTATVASMSSVSVPSASLILLIVVLNAADIPTEDVSLLFAVEFITDRLRTMNNMLGDCYAAAVIEKISQDELKDMEEPVKTNEEEELTAMVENIV